MKKCLLKLFTLLFAAVACLALFAACSPVEEPPVEEPPKEEPVHTHTWGSWKTSKLATCTEEGELERFCECGERESKEIKMLDHDVIWESDGDGITHHGICSKCGEVGFKEECIFESVKEEYFCTICGAPSVYNGIFTFTLNKKTGDSYTINKGRNCTEIDLVIPERFSGKPVIAVGRFSSGNFHSVKLPETIKSIGNFSFTNCSSLKKVELNVGLEKINTGAFNECTSITEITLPEGLKSIGENAFEQCASLSKIYLPDTLIEIQQYAFKKCASLIEIKIPDSVTEIKMGTFEFCNSLKKAVLPGALESLGSSAFMNCTALEEVIIPDSMLDTLMQIEGSAFFNTPWHNNQPDGLLYIGRVLYEYKGLAPEGTFIDNIRPDTVAIAGNAFGKQSGRDPARIVGVVIPRSVKAIGASAFSDCVNLKSIILPDSVESVGLNAFSSSGVTVYFEASTEPKGWKDAIRSYSSIVFGCKLSEDGTYVVSFEKKDDKFVLGSVGTNHPTRKGYFFGGWTITQNGESADYTSADVHKAPNGTTLYAIWKKEN